MLRGQVLLSIMNWVTPDMTSVTRCLAIFTCAFLKFWNTTTPTPAPSAAMIAMTIMISSIVKPAERWRRRRSRRRASCHSFFRYRIMGSSY